MGDLVGWRRFAVGTVLAILAAAAQAQPMPSPANPGAQPNIQVGTLEVRDITLGTPGTGTVSIGRITFKGFSREAESVRAETVEFSSVVARLGIRKIEVPSITIRQFEVPTDLFRALSEGGSPALDWAALLQKSSAAELTADAATDTFELSPAIKVAYGGLTLKNFKNGVLESAKAVLANGETDEPDPADRLKFAIGEVLNQGVNVAELVRFVTGGGSGEAKSLVERSTVSNIGVDTADAKVLIAKLEMVGLHGRAPEQAVGSQPAGPRIVMPGLPDPASPKQAAAFARDVLKHMRLERYAAEGIQIDAGLMGTSTIGAVSITGMSGGAFELFEIKDADIKALFTEVKFARFAIEKVSYGALLDMVLEAAANDREPDFSLAKLTELMPRFGAILLNRLEVATPMGPFALAEFRFAVDNPDVALPELTTLALNGLALDLSLMPPNPGREKLIALGYEQIIAGAQIQIRWIPGEKVMAFENTHVEIEKAGRIDVGIRLGNVDLAALAADPDDTDRIMQQSHFAGASAQLADFGLADRLFAEMARTTAAPPDALRAAIAAQMRAQATLMLGPALAPGSAEAIETFIQKPTKITAKVTPRPGTPPLTHEVFESLPPEALMQRLLIEIAIPKD